MPLAPGQKTHRVVKNPTISARDLADFMVASERRRRTIVQDAKYRSTARIIQHKQARTAVARYLCDPALDLDWLHDQAEHLREAIADDDFDRNLYDNNADYIDRFFAVAEGVKLPKATVMPEAISKGYVINGVKVSPQISFQFSRVNKNNKVRIGGCAIRYAKGKTLPEDVAQWQSAFMFGFLGVTNDPDAKTPELKLCLTIDAHAGKAHEAPTDSVTRFNEMKATCATVAEWWPNVEPPKGAII